jgi:hypothetical protein
LVLVATETELLPIPDWAVTFKDRTESKIKGKMNNLCIMIEDFGIHHKSSVLSEFLNCKYVELTFFLIK